MKETNSSYENATGVVVIFVLVSLIFFVILAQSHVSAGMQTVMTDLFSHY